MSPRVVPDPAPAPVEWVQGLNEDTPAPERFLRRWGGAIPWAVAVVVIVVVVAIIRSNSPGSTPGSLTPETVKAGTHAALIPVSATVLDQFTVASTGLNAANVTVTHALATSSGQSVAQVTQELSPYVTSLSEFAYTVHFVAWPQALQVPAQDLTLRTQDFISFLQSISSESTATLKSWFGQLHTLANETETADNLVRKDVGLASTSSYP